jgi:hypothetical protein
VVIGLSIIPPAFAQYNQPQSTMSVSTDKLSYNYRDIVRINGQGAESYSISIRIMSPSGAEITKLSTFKTGAGEFSIIWKIPSGIEKGTYIIKASDATQTAQTSFTLGTPIATQETGSKTKIPEWIKQIAEFWITDQIDDAGFVKVIEYLVKEGIITIPYAEAPEGESAAEIPSWIKTSAQFWTEGNVSDDEFALSLEWLINNGIIRV